ncbi:MAG: zinc metallopeptidase [Acidobacteriota bacterium]
MPFIDPTYILLVMLPGFLLSGIASWMTRSAFNKYSKVRSARGLSGAQAAQLLLNRAGISDVKIVPTSGYLSDHYNPLNKTLALSEPVYNSTSISAIGVACHEAGHAIQHAQRYAPLQLRSVLVPTAKIGSSIGMWGMMIGLFLGMQGLVLLGAVLFGGVLLFQVVTLPVEFDASARAKKLAVAQGIVTERERVGMDKVLNAAAMTYVAAAISTLLTLLYFLMRAGLLGGRND